MKNLLQIIIGIFLTIGSCAFAQDIYVYPNKGLAGQGQIEYRRYTLEQAHAYQPAVAGSFEPYLTTGWNVERRLTEDADAYGPKVITFGDSIFCTYSTIGSLQPYFIRSIDAGATWDQNGCLGDTSVVQFCLFPEIVSYNNELLIGFRGQEPAHGENLFYRKSTDWGITWSDFYRVFPYWLDDYANYSSICNSGRDIFFAYNEYDHDSLYVLRSYDWGQHWNNRGRNVAYLNGTPQPMTVRASGSAVHLVWVNEQRPISIRYSRSTDNGQNWSPEIDIAGDSLGAQEPIISVCGSHVVISWMGYKYSPHIFTGDMFIRQSYDSGATWDTAQVLTDSHYVWMGSNYVKDSLIVVTWQDLRFSGGNDEVIVRYSTNYGLTWSDETRLSYGDYHSDSPVAVSTGNRIHVLWGDRREASPGLYYAYNDLITGIEDGQIPVSHSILSAYPNPFNSSVAFSYPVQGEGEIEIYNVAGQLVKRLRPERKEARVVWDCRDDNGRILSSGIFLARVKTAGGISYSKVTYLK